MTVTKGAHMQSTRFGLQRKIIIIIAVAVICVVSVSTYIAMYLTRDLVEEEVYRKALAQARATAHQLVNQDALENSEKLQQVLRQMERDLPGVRQADVFRHEPEHSMTVTTSAGAEHLELDNITGIENYYEFERPDDDAITIETQDGKFWLVGTTIRDRGRSLGCLVLKVSKSRSSDVTAGLVKRNLLLMLASLTAVSLVIHLFFLKRVRSPVKEMIRVMESTESGQLDVRAHVEGQDEIGQLAEHLNLMLGRIENFNTELGRKVHEATAELARRNEELRQINEELFETQKTLAHSERLAVAGQLAAELAHEIGTPLNSISGHVELLARRKTWDAASERRLQIIEKQIENIVRTVKQLLSWSRKFEFRIEPVGVRNVLEESVLLASPALELRKIRAVTEMPAECPTIYADPGYLQQVFLNLINNSMDAMPRGGVLTLRLRYPAYGNGSEVAVEVADTGLGIKPEMLAHIFDPTFTTKRIGTGSGLGLAICDQIVRQHGGSIRVESEPGRGACFTVLLPIDCREKAEPLASTASIVVSSSAE